MIIIYHGSWTFLPTLACRLHLGQNITQTIKSPLSVAGVDGRGNAICCLVYGRYRTVYERAIQGICHLFGLHVRLVDVQQLLNQNATLRKNFMLKLFFSRWCPKLFHKYNQMIQQTLSTALQNIREAEP